MSSRPLNYVRPYRLACSLYAQDLAGLIGCDPSIITRIKKAERVPTTRVLMALQVVFGRTPHEVFPALYEQVEEAVITRAARLYTHLEGRTDKRSLRKRELLEDMMRRATKPPKRA